MTTPTLRSLIESYIDSPEILLDALKGEPLLQYEELHFYCSQDRMLTFAKQVLPNRPVRYTRGERDYTIILGDMDQPTIHFYVLDGIVSVAYLDATWWTKMSGSGFVWNHR